MSWLRSIIKKRKKIKVEGIPERFNTLYQFKYDGIIAQSASSDLPLLGSKESDTLFLEGETSLDSAAFLFFGQEGCELFSILQKRTKQKNNSLILSEKEHFESLEVKPEFYELPSLSLADSTFKKGEEWFEINSENIVSKVRKVIEKASVVYIFPQNDGFTFGLLIKILKLIDNEKKQPLIFLQIPKRDKDLAAEINTLAFIYYLMNLDSLAVPFTLFDEELLYENNHNMDSGVLERKLRDRKMNNIIDLLYASQLPSEFYKVEYPNFIRVVKGVKGPCSLLSYDVLDDTPTLSSLLNFSNSAVSFVSESTPTRGFIAFQPGPQGLSVKEYKAFRKAFSNVDVEFSIIKPRSTGSIIRGLLTSQELPSSLLDRYSVFSDVVIEKLDESGQVVERLNLDNIELLFENVHFQISKRPEEES
ncbi:MAG: hypothetical protein ACTSQE_07815 [Candidatus Heimdallarchaeaceae archaeon]